MCFQALGNTTVGQDVLELHAIPTDGRWYWIGIIALLAYVFLFNSIVTLALAYLNRKYLMFYWSGLLIKGTERKFVLSFGKYINCNRVVFCIYFIAAIKKTQTVIPVDVSDEVAVDEGQSSFLLLPDKHK